MIKTILSMFFILVASFVLCQNTIKTHSFSQSITCLSQDNQGFIIVGTIDGSVYRYDGLLPEKVVEVDAIINKIVVKESIWLILTQKGMYEWGNDQLKLISGTHLDVIDISADGKWLISRNGIYTKEGNAFVPDKAYFSEINSVKNGYFFEVDKQMYLGIDDQIYLHDKSWKLAISLPRKKLTTMAMDNSYLLSDQESIVAIDNAGYIDTIWNKARLNELEFFEQVQNKVWISANDTLSYLNVNTNQISLISETVQTDKDTDSTIDQWGNLWISFKEKIYQLNDGNFRSDDGPLIWIDEIKVDGKSVDKDQKIILSEEENQIDISFGGLHLSYPQMLSFEYRLYKTNEPIRDWKKVGRERSVHFRNLQGGIYSFELRNSIEENNYSFVPSLKIEVRDNFVIQAGLIFLGVAFLMLAMALFFNSRFEKLKRKNAIERKKLMDQNKMLTLQQKSMQLQMNPHFVFNALNSIQGLIAKEDSKNARKYLRHFSKMMRSMLNHSRVEHISIAQEIDYLNDYLELEKMANGDRFSFDINIDDKVDKSTMIPTMIIQPFIENAIVHGVKHLPHSDGKIIIDLKQNGRILHWQIIDNGIGRVASSKRNKSFHQSVAIELARERLGNTPLIKEPIVYHDLSDGSEALGTEVNVYMIGG